MRIDPRFLVESGTEIFNGSELLLKGCLETPGGVALLTGYPGSPVAGFFDACHDIVGLLAEHGIAAKMANNEALSVAMVNGAQMVGVKGIAVFKSVGVACGIRMRCRLGNLAGIPFDTGGALIVSGDDFRGASRRRCRRIRGFCSSICGARFWSRAIRKSSRIGSRMRLI